eukprot:1142088-Pelagomonas_calceolata.AAC.9
MSSSNPLDRSPAAQAARALISASSEGTHEQRKLQREVQALMSSRNLSDLMPAARTLMSGVSCEGTCRLS